MEDDDDSEMGVVDDVDQHTSKGTDKEGSDEEEECEGKALERFRTRYSEQCKTVGKLRTLMINENQFAEQRLDVSLNLRCNVKFVLYSYYYVFPMSFLQSLVLKGVDIHPSDLELILNSANMKKLVNLDVSDNYFLGSEGGDLCVLLAKELKALCFLDVEGCNVPKRQQKDVANLCFENFLRTHVFYDEVKWLSSIWSATKERTWENLLISAEVYDAIELGDLNVVFHRRWRRYAQKFFKRRSITPAGIMEALHGHFDVSLEDFITAALPPCNPTTIDTIMAPPDEDSLPNFRQLVAKWPSSNTHCVPLSSSGYVDTPGAEDDDEEHGEYPKHHNFPIEWFHPQFNLTRMTMASIFLPALSTT